MFLEHLQRRVTLLHLLAAGTIRLDERGDVFTRPLLLRHLVGGRVLLPLERLDLDNQITATLVEGRQGRKQRVGICAAIRKCGTHLSRTIAHESWIEHDGGNLILSYWFAPTAVVLRPGEMRRA